VSDIPSFKAPYACDDVALAQRIWPQVSALSQEQHEEMLSLGQRLIRAMRVPRSGIGTLDDVLREYALTSREGLALMALAEALLRIPDATTADALIEDKIIQGDFSHHIVQSGTWLASASAWALGLSDRLLKEDDDTASVWQRLLKRLGQPTMRIAIRQMMRLMGTHFVFAPTIEEALAKSATHVHAPQTHFSFDMLGEGARTEDDAIRYFNAYHHAIMTLKQNESFENHQRCGISIKLSALHPRYEAMQESQVLEELVPRVVVLARLAQKGGIPLTIDAEEAERLELSLSVIGTVLAQLSIDIQDDKNAMFGIAVQAYQKRALDVIEHIDVLSRHFKRRLSVRLVKGAYWDTEIKRAQEHGLEDYPVFTRKAMTDMHYLACAKRLLDLRDNLYPQFATHNAMSIAHIVTMTQGDVSGYEFQRLHGMGELLYDALLKDYPDVICRIYAPVGGHKDLLAYLVRRLLENGANTSFVAHASDLHIPIEALLKRPDVMIKTPDNARHTRIPLPIELFGMARRNSRGIAWGHRKSRDALFHQVQESFARYYEKVLLESGTSKDYPIKRPHDGHVIGFRKQFQKDDLEAAWIRVNAGFLQWSHQPVEARVQVLERMAQALENNRAHLMALLIHEAGKTWDDALNEWREAIDFCRYYAGQARLMLKEPTTLPGTTGEDNRLIWRSRGVWIAISPWNFPLAIFTGQIAAALVTGNTVIAKAAEQTPLIARAAVTLFFEAGLPPDVLALVEGDGLVGATLIADRRVAGVVFTGSMQTARHIQRDLAQSDGGIVPLIAETGGINAMIADASALPEQLVDDVIASAFRSAGQRCSALRLLCLQTDIADDVITMLIGALRSLTIGDPCAFSTHIGPVIDHDALSRLQEACDHAQERGTLLYKGDLPSNPALKAGTFFAPHIFEIQHVRDLRDEIFGPVLHIVRYEARNFEQMLHEIDQLGYGLTLGLATRITSRMAYVSERLRIGNIYINRSMIGAVVGSQPFGGIGLSGTGPKAGGPHYLHRFMSEQTITTNTSASGGNVSLLMLGEEDT
jgi:RHH-type proline utilization regulon transcriptional repressor/proline dehydrogenase/delta 1-pyrroline-5-carboxylate dehydrogenase